MHGTNPIRPPEHSDGNALFVQEIFPTLQGEGPFAGAPAVFIRLGGCNLACSFCDTEFESFVPKYCDAILEETKHLACNEAGTRVRHLVVITGGEPLRQNIAPLCEQLLAAGFTVQIETNGTLWRELPEEVRIVCSPKITHAKYTPLRPDVLARTEALKFLISAHLPGYGDIAEIGQSLHSTPVYVQPMDEHNEAKNAANTARALSLAQVHGYHLSLQLHKLLGIR